MLANLIRDQEMEVLRPLSPPFWSTSTRSPPHWRHLAATKRLRAACATPSTSHLAVAHRDNGLSNDDASTS
jgi:hypothetical protein